MSQDIKHSWPYFFNHIPNDDRNIFIYFFMVKKVCDDQRTKRLLDFYVISRKEQEHKGIHPLFSRIIRTASANPSPPS